MQIKNLSLYIPYILPVIGTSFFGWDAYVILLFFCIENFIQGIFFFLRGLFSVLVRRKIGGIIFLIFASGLFFTHATITLDFVEDLDRTGGIGVTISWTYLVINLTILMIPNILELYYFAQSILRIQKITSDKSQTKAAIRIKLEKQDIHPTLDFMLDFQEMFGRILVLWMSFPIILGIVFLSGFFISINILITNIIYITVFSIMHYKLSQFYVTQRREVSSSYETLIHKMIV